MISIIMATYNRAHTLSRAIDSVVRQDYPDWELIIVDDGSTDDTKKIIKQYCDPRIRYIPLSHNYGVTVAKNEGLDRIRGEWFTFLDSDDEIIPVALNSLMSVISRDPSIDAVTCNCLDSQTKLFAGHGLDRTRYVDFVDIFKYATGEHWGITKTKLLGSLRFNQTIPMENILWLRMDCRAKRYYLHEALRIYHTEGTDRVNIIHPQDEFRRKIRVYSALQEEKEYLRVLHEVRPEEYSRHLLYITIIDVILKKRSTALMHVRFLKDASFPTFLVAGFFVAVGGVFSAMVMTAVEKLLKPFTKRFIGN